ncbi:hypothetical protein KC852_00235 [Candidatus Nomurabacteria bacterium]|nr:hypothetical protein [Candidatus Nomurabacteria bacterium]
MKVLYTDQTFLTTEGELRYDVLQDSKDKNLVSIGVKGLIKKSSDPISGIFESDFEEVKTVSKEFAKKFFDRKKFTIIEKSGGYLVSFTGKIT